MSGQLQMRSSRLKDVRCWTLGFDAVGFVLPDKLAPILNLGVNPVVSGLFDSQLAASE